MLPQKPTYNSCYRGLAMKHVFILTVLAMLTTSCGLTKTPLPDIMPQMSPTQVNAPSRTTNPPQIASPTHTLTIYPSVIPTRSPTATQTPYPIPDGILTHEELQHQIDDWISGKIILREEDRLLEEKSGSPLRLGLLDKGPLNEVVFSFYNLGFTAIENKQGVPFLLNIVGFEDGKGGRFTFPFHNGRLFNAEKSLILGEYYGKRINREKVIFLDRFTPLQFVQIAQDFAGYINIGTTTIGSDGRGNEGDKFMQTSKEITNDITNFLECNICSLQEIPESLEIYVNQIPGAYEPALPYLWVYKVGY